MKSLNILLKNKIWHTKTISGATETIFLQLKSISYEISQHSVEEQNLVYQNDFRYDRNDFPALEMNLSLMPFGRP
jgi:hypothetical protein